MCKLLFHAESEEITSKTYREINSVASIWKCDDCAQGDPTDDESDGDDEEEEDAVAIATQKTLNELVKKVDTLCKQQTSQSKQLNEIVKSEQHISDQYDDLVKQSKQCQSDNASLRREVSTLTKKFTNMYVEIEQLKSQSNNLIQQKVSGNVSIRDLDGNEEPTEAVKKIADLIELSEATDCIATVKLVTPKDKKPVILRRYMSEFS